MVIEVYYSLFMGKVHLHDPYICRCRYLTHSAHSKHNGAIGAMPVYMEFDLFFVHLFVYIIIIFCIVVNGKEGLR